MTRHRQSGMALLISLLVLSVLSLIAVLSLRHLSLNLRAGDAYSAQLQAFDASENARAALLPILAAHLRTRGWPLRWGGTVADSEFPQDAALHLSQGALRDWYRDNSEKSAGWSPLSLDADVQYESQLGDPGIAPGISASLAVYRLRSALLSDGNAAFAQGYEGLGSGASGGGSAVLFYLHSEGRVTDREARAITGAIYRQVLAP